jgi:putative ABC transport system permease protein
MDAAASARAGMRLIPLESPIMEDVRTPFTVLMAAVVCVLLIACFNVGGLQMERSLARRREMALRLALGAGRGRLVRQTLTENVLLALIGALAGILATALTLRTIVSMLPSNVPYLDQIDVNVRVLAVTIGAATIVGLIAGLLPLAEMRRVAPARDLGDATRASERRGSWGRRALVVVEIALSIVVLIGAALMVQTFLTLRPTHPGFDPDHKLVMNVRLRGATPQTGEQFFGELLERLRVAPGIRDAAGAAYFPMSGNIAISSIKLGDAMKDVFTNYPTPGFLSLLKIPAVAGRMLSAGDTRGSEPVMMVNQLLATRIRPDGQVVGQRILVRPQGTPATEAPVERTIVGVLANTRNSGVHTRASAEAFIPYAQVPLTFLTIVAEAQLGREAEAALEMRDAVRQLRPDLIVGPPQSMEVMIRRRMGATPFGAWLLAVIAALAVGLAGIGLMTTIGWWVRQRRRELGVRIALGATRGGVTRLVLRQGMTVAVSGVVLGCVGAVGVTRYLSGWIYGVTPLDTATFAGCAVLMLVIAVCAVFIPVRQATSVDPVVALRTE